MVWAPKSFEERFRDPAFEDAESNTCRSVSAWLWAFCVLATLAAIFGYYNFITRGEVTKTATVNSFVEFETLDARSTSTAFCGCDGEGKVSDLLTQGSDHFKFDGELQKVFMEARASATDTVRAKVGPNKEDYWNGFTFFMTEMQSTIFDLGSVALPSRLLSKKALLAYLTEDSVTRSDQSQNSLRNALLMVQGVSKAGPQPNLDAVEDAILAEHVKLEGIFRSIHEDIDPPIQKIFWGKISEDLEKDKGFETFFKVCSTGRPQPCRFTEHETLYDVLLKVNAQLATVMAAWGTFLGFLYGFCAPKEKQVVSPTSAAV